MPLDHYGNAYEKSNNEYAYDVLKHERVAERNRKYRRRRIIRRRIIASIIMTMILVLIFFVVSLFIRVKEITITGDLVNYTYDEVLSASGIEVGDKMLYISKKKVANQIETSLPYMMNVKVKKRRFSKVTIEVENCSEAYALYINGEYVVVNDSFKALRFVSAEDENDLDVVKAIGLENESAAIGTVLSFKDASNLEYFQRICNGLQGEPFGKLDFVDVSNPLALRVGYKNGFVIELGNYINLDYNINWAKTVTKELALKHDEVNGTLNLTVPKKAYYTPRSGDEEPVSVE